MTGGKIALLAGAGYLLYETGLLSSLTGGLIPAPAAAPTNAPPAGTVSTGGGQPVNTSTPPPAAPPPTKALVMQAAQKAGDPALQTFDSWNFRFQGIRGVAGPDPGTYLTPATRNENLSIDEWWSYMQKAGFSGLGRFGQYARQFSGMGRAGLGCPGCAGETQGGYVPLGMGRWIF
jgi:hypothetical protein